MGAACRHGRRRIRYPIGGESCWQAWTASRTHLPSWVQGGWNLAAPAPLRTESCVPHPPRVDGRPPCVHHLPIQNLQLNRTRLDIGIGIRHHRGRNLPRFAHSGRTLPARSAGGGGEAYHKNPRISSVAKKMNFNNSHRDSPLNRVRRLS